MGDSSDALADITNDDVDDDDVVVVVDDACARQHNHHERPALRDEDDAREGAMAGDGGSVKITAEQKAALKAEKLALKAAKEAEKARAKADKESARERVAREKEAAKAEKAKIQAEKEALERAVREEKAQARAAKEKERERVAKEKEAAKAEKAKIQAEKEAEERAAKEKAAKQANKFASFFKTPVKKKSAVEVVVTQEVSPAVKEKLDAIIKADGAAEDIGTVREDLLNRWRTNKDKGQIVNRWAKRRVERDIEVMSILTSPSGKRSRGDMEKSSRVRRRRLFMIDCNEFARPAFWGTGPFPSRPKLSTIVTGRAPFKMDIDVDYEYDSAEDWVEEEPGESLSDADDGDEEAMSDADDDDDGFIAYDDEIASSNDGVMFDAATIGDDEDLVRMRRKLSTLVSRSKRAQMPLIITSLAPSTPPSGDQRMDLDEDGEMSDVSLLSAFAIETSPNAPRVTLSLEASTSMQTSPPVSRSAPKTIMNTASKKNADEIVATNLRALVEVLLKNPQLRVNQVAEKFIEEASTIVAGLKKSAVKRKIAEIATYQSRWLITSATIEAVGLSEDEVAALRPVEVARVKSTAKKLKPNAPTASTSVATPRTLESCFQGAKTKEYVPPSSLDDEKWMSALTSLQQTQTDEDWPENMKQLFDVTNLCACVANGVVPMFFITALMKTASLRGDKRACRLACARLVGPMLKKLDIAAKTVYEQKVSAPSRATIELACSDTSLINKFIEANIEADDVILKEAVLDVVFALTEANSVPVSAQKAIHTIATTIVFLEFLAASLDCERLRYKSARVIRSVLHGVHVETCSVFRPMQVTALMASLVESIRKAQSAPSADSLKYLPDALRAFANIAEGSPDAIECEQASAVFADLIECCSNERQTVAWGATTDALVAVLEKISDTMVGANEGKCAFRIASVLSASPEARLQELATKFSSAR